MTFKGAPAYLGQNRDGTEMFSGHPDRVVQWLSDGYRARFNQLRSNRSKYVYEHGERQCDSEGEPLLVPIGHTVTDVSDKEARQQFSHLTAMPAMVLQHPNKVEPTEWFAAVKRRKTLVRKGQPGGAMPGFRCRKREDIKFACWFNGGANATFHETGRRSGMVVIRGRNPRAHDNNRSDILWALRVHVVLSQPIRDYTSVMINASKKTVTFVNDAPEANRSKAQGSVGIDRGVVHQAVCSDGTVFDLPKELLAEADSQVKYLHSRMAKSRVVAEKQGRNTRSGSRYKELKRRLNKATAYRARVRKDATHKATHAIATTYHTAIVEDLNVKSMTRSTSGKGARGKRGLNREILNSNWSTFLSQLEYKLGGNIHVVNPAYTSQRCSSCGHIAAESRESQSDFRCVACTFSCNADVNAAKNIEAKHYQGWAIPAWSKDQTVEAKASTAPALKRKPPALTTL